MTVEFIPNSAGLYVIELLGPDGKSLQRELSTVNPDGVNKPTSITLQPLGTMPTPAPIVFRVPTGAKTAIRKITFALPKP